MSDDSSALATGASPSPQTDAGYDAIRAALMETARGRAFLAEHARRNRSADIAALLAASERIEATMREQRAAEVTAPAPQEPPRDDVPADSIPQSGQPAEHGLDERVPAISWFDATPAPAATAEPLNDAPPSPPAATASADDFADLLFEPMGERKPDRTESHAVTAKPVNGSASASSVANPARHRARPEPRTSDPLASLKAMSDEEKIALFS
jgi:hypothetical protein